MKLVVLGAGTMGHGIGQLAAMNGHDVAIRDTAEGQLGRARGNIERSLDKLVEKERLTREDAEATRGRLRYTVEVSEVLASAEVVIEAVPEIVGLKHQVLAEVTRLAPEDALIGTNTSQFSITSLGAPLGDAAARLIGTHFFNPPVLMKLVELVKGVETTEATVERARELVSSLGREVVVCRKDAPGFITSRAYAILRLECLRMVEEGVASPEDIDKAMRLGFNFPMGPLELGDFNGLDTYLHALEALTEVYGERFRPTIGLRNLVAAGHLGRKTGRGFYDYPDQEMSG